MGCLYWAPEPHFACQSKCGEVFIDRPSNYCSHYFVTCPHVAPSLFHRLDGGDSSNGSVIRTPIGGDMDEDDEDNCSSHGSVVRHPVESYEEDGYSSGGSVVRLPIGTAIGFDAHPDEEDGYSSDDSVVRVPIPRGADDNKGDGYSSDGSVVRMLVGKECSKHGSERQRGQDDGTQAVSLGQPKDGDLGEEERGCAKEAPPISKNMNLQAAAKYFAKSGQGGASSGAASGQSNGSSHVIQHYEENPQVSEYTQGLRQSVWDCT